MSRYIDANILRPIFQTWYESFDWCDGETEKHTIATAIRTLDAMQTADVVERRRGKWIEDKEQNHVELTFHCSECGCEAWGIEETTNFCPECGAEMVILFQNF